jgi:hypothetical protein
VFFMLIGIPRWLQLQDIVFTKDQLVLFITRWTMQALESLWLIIYFLPEYWNSYYYRDTEIAGLMVYRCYF